MTVVFTSFFVHSVLVPQTLQLATCNMHARLVDEF